MPDINFCRYYNALVSGSFLKFFTVCTVTDKVVLKITACHEFPLSVTTLSVNKETVNFVTGVLNVSYGTVSGFKTSTARFVSSADLNTRNVQLQMLQLCAI